MEYRDAPRVISSKALRRTDQSNVRPSAPQACFAIDTSAQGDAGGEPRQPRLDDNHAAQAQCSAM